MSADVHLVALFKAELELCKVGSGETLAVVTQGGGENPYSEAFLTAARQLGASAFQINLPTFTGPSGVSEVGATALTGNRVAIEALKGADIVIDLIFMLYAKERFEIMAAGTRILTVVDSPDVLARRFPNPDLRRRVEAAENLLAASRTMHITSAAGTDVTYRLGRYPVVAEYGYVDKPGRWDCWPSGFLLTGAHDDGVDGQVVIDVGDILFAFRRYAEARIVLKIEKGYITSIEGDSIDATMLRQYMESFNDPRSYAISHIGWGLDERANWHQLAVSPAALGSDILAFQGNVLFSTGPNGELGGTNDTLCHLDIPLRNCSLTLDGQAILENGRVVHPEMAAPELSIAAE